MDARGEGTELRVRAWAAFERGDFATARAAFGALVAAGEATVSDARAWVELESDNAGLAAGVAAMHRALESWAGERPFARLLTWAIESFKLAGRLPDSPELAADAGRVVAELLASNTDPEVWHVAECDGLLERIEAAQSEPLALIDVLEQLSFAPDQSSVRARSVGHLEAVGHLYAGDQTVARAAERSLHALGESAAAYRVERAKRAAIPAHAASAPSPARDDGPALRGLRVAIAGGHPALRAVIRRDLARSGITDLREIPSRQEASRIGRDVQATIAGADVAVLLVRQLAHSTSDQVRKAADRERVPVVISDSAGVSGVRRALERFCRERARTTGLA